MPPFIYPDGINRINAKRRERRERVQWLQDAECVGQIDPIDLLSIPQGKGFKLEADLGRQCYNVENLAEMKTRNMTLISPVSRQPFTPNDIQRINNYIENNRRGGNKKKTYKKRKTNKTKRINKKRKTTRKIK